ncbi:MAG: hypothetical protein OEZ13_10330 [Spirochaetia bacterium]|nr:hypothetical protein [Spirochaetia bacterium]
MKSIKTIILSSASTVLAIIIYYGFSSEIFATHSTINYVCADCHDVTSSPSVTTEPLFPTTSDAIGNFCMNCHAAGKPGDIFGFIPTNHDGHAPITYCGDCHTPHLADAGTNAALIEAILSTYTVNTYTDITTAVDNTGTGVCQVCHTATAQYRNQSVVPSKDQPDLGSHTSGDQAVGGNCKSCHNHYVDGVVKGWSPAGGDCLGCHGGEKAVSGSNPPFNRVAATNEFNTNHHVVGSGITIKDCSVCHVEGDTNGDPNPTYHKNGVVDLRDPDTQGNVISLTNSTATQRFQRTRSVLIGNDTYSTEINALQNNFCLGCHDVDGAQNSDIVALGFSAAQPFSAMTRGSIPNVDAQLSTAHYSFHPVKGTVGNPFALATSPGAVKHLASPYNTGTASLITCFDCHANGAHGGGFQRMIREDMLVGPDYNGLTEAAIPAGWDGGGVAGTGGNGFCNKCHDPAVYSGGDDNNTGAMNRAHDAQHSIGSDEYGCAGCHGGPVRFTMVDWNKKIPGYNYCNAEGNGSAWGNIHGNSYNYCSTSPWNPGGASKSFVMGGRIYGYISEGGGAGSCWEAGCKHNGDVRTD